MTRDLNLEFYPKSTRTQLAKAQAFVQKNDKVSAVHALETALELDPQNEAAKRQRAALRMGGSQ